LAPREAVRLEAAWANKFPRVRLTRIGALAPLGVAEGLRRMRGFDHFSP